VEGYEANGIRRGRGGVRRGVGAGGGPPPQPRDGGSSDVHDVGLLWLRVWNNGSVWDPEGGTGVYPAPDGPANVYFGGLWVAGKSGGVVRMATPDEWSPLTPVVMSWDPTWAKLPPYVRRESDLDSYYRMDDSRAGGLGPVPMTVESHGLSWGAAPYDDFVGFRYNVANGSDAELTDSYVALAYDADIGGPLSYVDDYVGFDAERKMPYMYDATEGNPYLGIVTVGEEPWGAHTWDIDDDPASDDEKYAYMSAPGFDCERTDANDWRLFITAGPYDIPAGATKTVTFAVVAGEDLEALQRNADAARELLLSQPGPDLPKPSFALRQNWPNPVVDATSIRFSCVSGTKVTLAVYDLAGRRVATLARGYYGPGEHEVTWAPAGVPPGVYVYALESPASRLVKRMVITH